MESYDQRNKNRSRLAIAIAAIAVVALLILYVSGVFGGGGRRLSARRLRCVVSQQVTPFGDRLLYYDGSTLFCLSANGSELWKYVVGSNAGFSVSDRLVVAWVGAHLHILDKNGRVTFNDRLTDNIQFARAGSKYVAAVVGENISPTLVVKDINGLSVDSESVAYEDKMLLDIGFFENGDYLWSTALDVLGVAPVTVMNIYRVGAMNTGEVELGQEITYSVLYSGQKLHVINTRDISHFDNRGSLDPFARQLVWGWQLVDSVTGSGDAMLLFVPSLQTGDEQQITSLRVIEGRKDSRYTLPDTCVGAGIRGNTIFAFSKDSLFRADISAQRFSALQLPGDIRGPLTGYIGKLSNGVALVNSGEDVYAVTLP